MIKLYEDFNFNIFKLETTEEFLQWDKFLLQSKQGTPFCTSYWFNNVCKIFNAKYDIIVLYKGENWLAGVTVLYKSFLYGKKRCWISPLTAYNSFIYAENQSIYPNKVTAEHIAVSKTLARFIQQRYIGVKHLLSPSIEDVRPWQWSGYKAVPRYTYHINLIKELMLSHSVRKHIRKCSDAGFTVSWKWNMAHFWQVYQHTMSRQSFGIGMSKMQFFDLANQLYDAGLAWMGTAYEPAGTPVSSRIQLAVPGSGKLFDWVAGAHPAFLKSGVTPWLMVQFLREAYHREYHIWDLCGADYESIARFKSEFGGKIVHYFQVQSQNSFLEYSLYGLSMVRGVTRNLLGR